MIELVGSQDDDVAFIELVQRIINGALATLQPAEVYLVQVDNWFDFKWLGWWSRGKYELTELYVPPFNPNRVLPQKHFLWDAKTSQWTFAGEGKHFDRSQKGRHWHALPINRISKLVVSRPLETGVTLDLSLSSGPTETRQRVAVVVRYCFPCPDGDWLVGCALPESLSCEELLERIAARSFDSAGNSGSS